MGIPVSLRCRSVRNVLVAAFLVTGCAGVADAQHHGGGRVGGGHGWGGPLSSSGSGDHGGSTATSPSHLQRSSGGGGTGKRSLALSPITPLVLKAQPVLLPSVFPEHLRSPFPYKPKSGGGNPGGSNPAKCAPGTAALPGHGVPSCGGIAPHEPLLDFAAATAASCEYTLLLKDGRTFCVKNYWVEGDRLYFTTFNGSVGSVPSSLFEEVRAAKSARDQSLSRPSGRF
jgi:hypothetical protein